MGRTSIVELILNPVRALKELCLAQLVSRVVEKDVLVRLTLHLPRRNRHRVRPSSGHSSSTPLASPESFGASSRFAADVGVDFVLRHPTCVCWHHQCSTSTTNNREVAQSRHKAGLCTMLGTSKPERDGWRQNTLKFRFRSSIQKKCCRVL